MNLYSGRNNVVPGRFLLTLITLDVLFIAVHLGRHFTGLLPSPMMALSEDGGYAEFYQYAKWATITGLMLVTARMRKSPEFSVWAVFTSYLLLDDALRIHERVGDQLDAYKPFQPMFNLRLEDIGELGASTVVGVALLVALYRAYASGDQGFREASLDFGLLVIALAVVGIGIDMLQVSAGLGSRADFLFGLLEDGGEMVVASMMLWYTALISRPGQDVSDPFAEGHRLRPALRAVFSVRG